MFGSDPPAVLLLPRRRRHRQLECRRDIRTRTAPNRSSQLRSTADTSATSSQELHTPLHPAAVGISAGRPTGAIPSSRCRGSAASRTAAWTTAAGCRSAASANRGARPGKVAPNGASQSEQVRQVPGHLSASTAAASCRSSAARTGAGTRSFESGGRASSERSTGQRLVRGASASSRPYNAWSSKVAQLIWRRPWERMEGRDAEGGMANWTDPVRPRFRGTRCPVARGGTRRSAQLPKRTHGARTTPCSTVKRDRRCDRLPQGGTWRACRGCASSVQPPVPRVHPSPVTGSLRAWRSGRRS